MNNETKTVEDLRNATEYLEEASKMFESLEETIMVSMPEGPSRLAALKRLWKTRSFLIGVAA